MMIAAGIAIGALLGFAVVGRWIARRLPPAVAGIFLVAGSLITGGSTVVVLGVLASTWLGASPLLARLVPWSTSDIAAINPDPPVIGQLSSVLLLTMLVYGSVRAVRKITGVVGVMRDLRDRVIIAPEQLPTVIGGPKVIDRLVIVVDDDAPDAFSTPFPTGRIFVTTGLVQALTPAELRVVLLHELAHLRYGHGWLRLAAELVRCFIPFLGRVAGEVDLVTERWADEFAANKCGDRRTVASAVARVGLLRPETTGERVRHLGHPAEGVAAASGGDVVTRVRSMLAPAVVLSPRVGIAALALLVAAGVSGVTVAGAGGDLFEDATPPFVHHVVTMGGFTETTPGR